MPRRSSVHFRLRQPNKQGLYNIQLVYKYHRNELKFQFGQFVKKEDWNYNKERVKNKTTTTSDGKFYLNDLLEKLEKLCEKTINERISIEIPTPDYIKQVLWQSIDRNRKGLTEEPLVTLKSLAKVFISGEIKSKSGNDKSKATLENYEAVLAHLIEFEKKKKYRVDFDTITHDFFNKYVDFLRHEATYNKGKVKGLKRNTIAKDISILKVFMNEAVKREYTTNMKFRDFTFGEEEVEHVYLTELELDTIYNLEIENKKLREVRDLFIVGAWLGLRYSDLTNIKKENIIEEDGVKFISLITQKTKEKVIIPCHHIVLEIMEKYKEYPNSLPPDKSNQKFNDYIKIVCELAGFTQLGRLTSKPNKPLYLCISSHTARRSFATNYYLQGFPTIDLMKITGHQNEETFLKYIKVSKKDSALRLSEHQRKWKKRLLDLES
jgi:integrase